MGRELRRVPMDFDWPQGHIWKGYINPYHGVKCPYCDYDGSSNGETVEARKYVDTFYGFAMGYRYIPHPYIPGRDYCPYTKPYKWDRWEYDFIVADPELSKRLFGDQDVPAFVDLREYFLTHEYPAGLPSEIRWALTKEYCRRNGYEYRCPHCDDGVVYINDEIKKLHDEWEPVDPPTGEGYQLWETTSEGSPKSPVFATLDELCEWCETNATTFAHFKATKEQWKKMLENDFVYHEEGNFIMI